MGKQKFSLDGLTHFVVEGKKHGYAGGSKKSSPPRRPGFHEFVFRRGVWEYVDSYAGLYSFFGDETVSFDRVPVLGMAYRGGVSEELRGNLRFSEQVYAFLLKNLARVSRKHPFRGPELFQNHDFIYHNVAYGDISDFKGRERIISRTHFKNSQQVYNLHYFGGLIVRRDYGLIQPTS